MKEPKGTNWDGVDAVGIIYKSITVADERIILSAIAFPFADDYNWS